MSETLEAPVISGRRTKQRPTPPPEAPTVDDLRQPPSADKPFALTKWWGDMRGDTAARKARNPNWWAMRWMGEQPTSVADHVDYILNQRYERPDGRKGWGLRTEAALIDGTHAAFYVTYGLTVGLVLTLLTYAVGWIAQRPGRAFLALALAYVVITNLSTWLAGS